jgi:hypothetical protein
MNTFHALLLLALVPQAASAPPRPTPSPKLDLYEVTFPAATFPKGSRVAGFSIAVRGGWVVSIIDIPKNWSVGLSMDPPCCPEVSGAGHHGADSLPEGERLTLKLIVERWSGKHASEFSIRGSIQVTTDSEHLRSRSFSSSEMVVHHVGT